MVAAVVETAYARVDLGGCVLGSGNPVSCKDGAGSRDAPFEEEVTMRFTAAMFERLMLFPAGGGFMLMRPGSVYGTRRRTTFVSMRAVSMVSMKFQSWQRTRTRP